MEEHRCGTIAIAGRPNTGKSSLLNRLVGQKIAIVSPKAQTTRNPVGGILTSGDCQYVFLDLPGYQTRHVNVLNRALNRRASEGTRDCDAVLFVLEAQRYGAADREVLERIPMQQRVVATVNKIDLLQDAAGMLPLLERLQKEREFHAIVPVSAKTGKNVPELLRVVHGLMPPGPSMYPADQLTDRNERFLAGEILREKLFLLLGAEVPYECEVELNSFKEEGKLRRIEATVWVAREGQKAIVVGKGGALLKRIGSAARRDMERLFGGKVYLGLWVKVKRDWTRDPRLLRQLGYG